MARKSKPSSSSRGRNVPPPPVNPEVPRLVAEAARQRQSGDLEGAKSLLGRVLELDSRCAEAHFHLGQNHIARDDLAPAVASFQAAIDIQPAYPEAHLTLGLLFRANGDNGTAENHFREAVKHRPEYAEAHFLLGQGLMDQSKSGEAAASLGEAVRLKPGYHQAHFLLGKALRALGDLDGVIESYQSVLRQTPDAPEVHLNLGATLQERGDHEEALNSFRHALHLRPGYAEAYFGLGATHFDQQELSLAEENYKKAIEHKPEYLDARQHLALVYSYMGKFDEANFVRQETLKLHPENMLLKFAFDISCPAVFDSSAEIDNRRDEIDNALETYDSATLKLDLKKLDYFPSPPFYMAFRGRDEKAWRTKYAAIITQALEAKCPDLIKPISAIGADRAAGGPIRVGYLTTYNSEGPFLAWMKGIALNLPRDTFEVTIICHGRSQAILSEDIGKRDEIDYLLMGESIEATVKNIQAQKFDVIIYHEVGTSAFNYLLPFFRLAPVQCATLGWGYTTGVPEVDYFISTHTAEPENCEAHYSENLIRFDTAPAYFYRPTLPDSLKDRSNFGFTETDHIYACPQSLFKIHPDFIELLGEIL